MVAQIHRSGLKNSWIFQENVIFSNYFWDHQKEAIGHNEILNEIQLLKEQISKIKEKKNMNSTKTPIPVSLNKLFTVLLKPWTRLVK